MSTADAVGTLNTKWYTVSQILDLGPPAAFASLPRADRLGRRVDGD
ncbi:MAG: hypothetical protein QXJ59_08890 [Thermofilaceae archaeon]